MPSSMTATSPSPTERQPQVPRIQRRDVIAFAALAVISALLFLPLLGHAGMFDPTDSFFVETPREMLQTGKFTVPMFNYDPWLDKPAFAFWLIIASYKCLGISEFAARLPSALSGIFLVLSTFVLTRQVLTRRQAFLSALVLATSPLFVIVGHVALTDEPLALFLTVALFSIAISLAKKSFKILFLAYAALGFAALCKGPPLTLVLVGVITIANLLLINPRRILQSILRLHPVMAIAIILLIAAPYYVWAHLETHGAFTQTFFIGQNVGRMVGNVNHVNPWWWYIPVALGGFFPWSLCLAAGGKFLGRIVKQRSRLLTARRQLIFFCICWATLGFVIFSAVPTKLQTYIIPLFPALAVTMGNYLDLLIRKNKCAPLVAAAVGMILLAVAAPLVVHMLSKGVDGFAGAGYACATILVLGSVISTVLNRRDAFSAAITVFTAIIVGCGTFIPILFSLYHDKYQITMDHVVNFSHDQGANLATVKYIWPSVMFRYKEKIPQLVETGQLQEYANLPGKRWILVHNDVLSLLCWTERSPRVVTHEGNYWIFAVGKDAIKEPSVEWHGLLPQYHYPTVEEAQTQYLGVRP